MDVFVARQPIFDEGQKVYAYELLFRSSGVQNFYSHTDQDQASSKVIADSALLFGWETITGGKKAFVNVTRDVLLKEYVSVLPKQLAVVEILETVDPDDEIVSICRKLKQEGYILALDDFVYGDGYKPLLELTDIIKVDFLGTDPLERQNLVNRLAPLRIKFLAEKVETRNDFEQAVSMGYSYFQGYFFSKPVILQHKDIPRFKLNYLQVLQEIHHPQLNLEQLEAIIKREVSLAYKLLRYINSPFFGWRQEISSIRHALTLLGDKNVKKWASFMILAGMGEDKPEELVTSAVIRAKFCEFLAAGVKMKHREQDFFLMGMFSLIDAIVDRPLDELLKEIPIAEDIKNALLGEQNTLRAVYEVVLSYEKADWKIFSYWADKLKLDEMAMPEIYLKSLEWASQTAAQPA